VHASDLADVLEEDSGGAQHQDGHLRTRGRHGVSVAARRRKRGRRSRVWGGKGRVVRGWR